MATRFYLPASGATPVTPPFSSDWEHVNAARVRMVTTKTGTVISTFSPTPDAADHIVDADAAVVMYVSDPLAAQTIAAQTVTLTQQALENHVNNNLFLTWKLWIWTAAGAAGPTILPIKRDGLELLTTVQSRTDSATTTAVTVGDGDRIVFEVGYGGLPVAASQTQGHNGVLYVGDSGTDLAANDTATGITQCPWLEFANTLSFAGVAPATSGVAALRARTQVVATPQPSAYATAIQATAGLVGYWRLGEATGATRARDEINTNHGTYTGGPTLQQPGGPTTDANPSVAFDGINDLVALPNAFPFAGNVPYSIECWVNPDIISTTIYPVLVHHVDFAAPSKGWMLRLYRDNNRIQHERHFGNGTVQYSQTNNPIPIGSWHHVVATYDGTTVRLYIDGVDDTWYQDPDGVLVAATTAAGIGGIAGDVQFFDGRLDEVAIYNVALAPATVVAHYAAGGGITGPQGVGRLRARTDLAAQAAKSSGTAAAARAATALATQVAKSSSAVVALRPQARLATAAQKTAQGTATVDVGARLLASPPPAGATSGTAGVRGATRLAAVAPRAASATLAVRGATTLAAVAAPRASTGLAAVRTQARPAPTASRATVGVAGVRGTTRLADTTTKGGTAPAAVRPSARLATAHVKAGLAVAAARTATRLLATTASVSSAADPAALRVMARLALLGSRAVVGGAAARTAARLGVVGVAGHVGEQVTVASTARVGTVVRVGHRTAVALASIAALRPDQALAGHLGMARVLARTQGLGGRTLRRTTGRACPHIALSVALDGVSEFVFYWPPSELLVPVNLGYAYRGDTLFLPVWQAVDQRGNLIGLEGATVWFTAKADLADADSDPITIQCSTLGGGIEIIDAAFGSYRVTVPSAETQDLDDDTRFTFDVQVVTPVPTTHTVRRGVLAVIRDVTRTSG